MSQIGCGWALAVDDGASSAFVAIDDITSLTPPDDGPVGAAESKRLDISAYTVTRVPTVITPGAFSFSYEFDKTQYARLAALKRTAKNWKVTSTDGTPWTRTVPGFLAQQVIQPVTADGIVTVDVSVEVTGAAS
ncbi:MAG: hypothetical protein V4515_00110 [Chloroflexota bacterium]